MSEVPKIEWQAAFVAEPDAISQKPESATWVARFGNGWLVRHYNVTGNETMTYVPDEAAK